MHYYPSPGAPRMNNAFKMHAPSADSAYITRYYTRAWRILCGIHCEMHLVAVGAGQAALLDEAGVLGLLVGEISR